jgi:NAD(P)H dehydrogenase (quinone)
VNVLLVYAHPEPRSLNGSIRDFTVDRFVRAGHSVEVSDLYAMRWKAGLDADDFPQRDATQPFSPSADSRRAFNEGTQTADVAAEQDKLRRADLVIFQFPMWWFSMPAIMKGWFERVYAYGFAYGVGEHSEKRWGKRYGEGVLSGKRAMLVVTTGGWADHYSERGINADRRPVVSDPARHVVLSGFRCTAAVRRVQERRDGPEAAQRNPERTRRAAG